MVRQKDLSKKIMSRANIVGGYYSKRLQKKVPVILDRYFSIIFEEIAKGEVYPRCGKKIQLLVKELTNKLNEGEFHCVTYPYKKFVVSLGSEFEGEEVTFVPNEKFIKLIQNTLDKTDGCQKTVNRYDSNKEF